MTAMCASWIERVTTLDCVRADLHRLWSWQGVVLICCLALVGALLRPAP